MADGSHNCGSLLQMVLIVVGGVLHGPLGVGLAGAFLGAPEDAVELVFRTLVRLVQRETRGDVSIFAQERVGNFFRLGV